MSQTKMQKRLSESPILSSLVYFITAVIGVIWGTTAFTCDWVREFHGCDAMYEYKSFLRYEFKSNDEVKKSYHYFSYNGIHEMLGMAASRWSSIKCLLLRTKLIYKFTRSGALNPRGWWECDNCDENFKIAFKNDNGADICRYCRSEDIYKLVEE